MKRTIVRFTDKDIGKHVKFSPHPDSLVYEQWLVGKSGIIQKVRNCSFDQQITVDFNYVLQFPRHPHKGVSIFPARLREAVIKSIEGGQITFHKHSYEKTPSVCGLGLDFTGGKSFVFLKEENYKTSFYYNEPTTAVQFISSYSEISPIGPSYEISADNLVWDN